MKQITQLRKEGNKRERWRIDGIHVITDIYVIDPNNIVEKKVNSNYSLES